MAHNNLGKVMTINGPVNPEDLGYTLPHEHLYFNTAGYKPEMTAEQEAVYKEPVTLKNLCVVLHFNGVF